MHRRLNRFFSGPVRGANMPRGSWWIGKDRTFAVRARLEFPRIRNSKFGRGHVVSVIDGRWVTPNAYSGTGQIT